MLARVWWLISMILIVIIKTFIFGRVVSVVFYFYYTTCASQTKQNSTHTALSLLSRGYVWEEERMDVNVNVNVKAATRGGDRTVPTVAAAARFYSLGC